MQHVFPNLGRDTEAPRLGEGLVCTCVLLWVGPSSRTHRGVGCVGVSLQQDGGRALRAVGR